MVWCLPELFESFCLLFLLRRWDWCRALDPVWVPWCASRCSSSLPSSQRHRLVRRQFSFPSRFTIIGLVAQADLNSTLTRCRNRCSARLGVGLLGRSNSSSLCFCQLCPRAQQCVSPTPLRLRWLYLGKFLRRHTAPPDWIWVGRWHKVWTSKDRQTLHRLSSWLNLCLLWWSWLGRRPHLFAHLFLLLLGPVSLTNRSGWHHLCLPSSWHWQ